MVANTIGTAPRSPAHDRNACSRQGTRNGVVASATAMGRAIRSATSPASRPGTIACPSLSGDANSPNSTKTPICAIQPSPSANDRVFEWCGNRELPSTRPARKVASSPDASASCADAYASTHIATVANG